MIHNLDDKDRGFFEFKTNTRSTNMKSSSTSSWEFSKNQKLSKELEKEVLLTNSTRELVEFYWSNRKRFSHSYTGFPVELK